MHNKSIFLPSRNARKIAAHQNTASDLNTFTDTFPDNMRMKIVMTITRCCVLNTSKSGDELISMKETGRTTLLHPCESDLNHVRIWLVSSALYSVEGRVWTAHTAIKSRGCHRFPLLSALWLVGDSVAVSLRCVWTRDWMMSFKKYQGSSSVVSSCLSCLLMVTGALMDIRTSQDMDRSRRHHTLQFTFMSHRS